LKYWADKRVALKELALRRLDNRVGKRSFGETRACEARKKACFFWAQKIFNFLAVAGKALLLQACQL